MTVKELFEFAQKYNLEDAELQFFGESYYSINRAKIDVDTEYSEQNKIILSD